MSVRLRLSVTLTCPDPLSRVELSLYILLLVCFIAVVVLASPVMLDAITRTLTVLTNNLSEESSKPRNGV